MVRTAGNVDAEAVRFVCLDVGFVLVRMLCWGGKNRGLLVHGLGDENEQAAAVV